MGVAIIIAKCAEYDYPKSNAFSSHLWVCFPYWTWRMKCRWLGLCFFLTEFTCTLALERINITDRFFLSREPKTAYCVTVASSSNSDQLENPWQNIF